MSFFYLVQRRNQPLDSLNQGDALEVTFEIYDTDNDAKPVLTGNVDWQDGVNFYYQQFMEPASFTQIMACAYEALKEARTMIGDNWSQSEPG